MPAVGYVTCECGTRYRREASVKPVQCHGCADAEGAGLQARILSLPDKPMDDPFEGLGGMRFTGKWSPGATA